MIRLLIADDHQIIIDGIKAMLENEPFVTIVGSATNGKELINTGLLLEPDLILMDIGMPEMDGITAARSIKKSHPAIKILVLTTYADQKSIREMLKMGVDGYILKDSGKGIFIEAIQAIVAGNTYFDRRVTEVMMKSFQQKKSKDVLTPLSPREKDIVRLIAEGKSTVEMAETLHLSLLTIETHRKNIYTKLGMNKVASLVRYALEQGLLD
ncbi:MAG TPA: response regulator transcription factor [Fluviicola sp.]|nr:response regulator transcription factor [Fluviicola sp.]